MAVHMFGAVHTGKAFGRQARCQASMFWLAIEVWVSPGSRMMESTVLSQCLWILSLRCTVRSERNYRADGGLGAGGHTQSSISETCQTRGTRLRDEPTSLLILWMIGIHSMLLCIPDVQTAPSLCSPRLPARCACIVTSHMPRVVSSWAGRLINGTFEGRREAFGLRHRKLAARTVNYTNRGPGVTVSAEPHN